MRLSVKRAHNERNNQFEKITQDISWNFFFLLHFFLLFFSMLLLLLVLHGMTEFLAISSSYDIRHNLLFCLPSGVKFVFLLRFVCWSKMVFVFLLSKTYIRIFVMDLKMLATDENLCNEKTKWEKERERETKRIATTETTNCQQHRENSIYFGRSYDSGNELLPMIAVSRANRLDDLLSHVFIRRWTQCQDGVRQTLVNRCLCFSTREKWIKSNQRAAKEW